MTKAFHSTCSIKATSRSSWSAGTNSSRYTRPCGTTRATWAKGFPSGSRQVGEQDHPGIEPLHVFEVEPYGAPVAEDVDVALAPHERVQIDLVLVDQALFRKGIGEFAAPMHEQVAVGLGLELWDRVL